MLASDKTQNKHEERLEKYVDVSKREKFLFTRKRRKEMFMEKQFEMNGEKK